MTPKTPVSAAIGGLIHELRTEKGLSLQRLAKMAGIQSTALARIEQGLAEPSIRILDELARQFDMSVIQLMTLAQKKKPAKKVDSAAVLTRIGREIAELPESLGDKIDAAEAATVKHAMHVCAGNQSAAARLLGLERKALVRRLAKAERARCR